ncbi:MAG: hypothetical protein SFU98_03500 [Leptospiraceae bacterium]|nr:hypothetical protein [Leptospiraceae bacterium]
MNKILLGLLTIGLALALNCGSKKDTSSRDSLLISYLAGTGGVSSTQTGSCLFNFDTTTGTSVAKNCTELDGAAPLGVNFGTICTGSSGTLTPGKNCSQNGYAKDCKKVSVGGFGVNQITCSKN